MQNIKLQNKGQFLGELVTIEYLKDSSTGNIKKGQKTTLTLKNAIDLIEKGIAKMLN